MLPTKYTKYTKYTKADNNNKIVAVNTTQFQQKDLKLDFILILQARAREQEVKTNK